MGRMVKAGRVSGLFGAKGELSLALYDDFPRQPNPEEPVFVNIDSHTVPLFFTTFARRGQRGATALFADIDTEARAAELVGLELYIREGGVANEAEDDELYFEDLVGWSVELSGTEAEVGTGEVAGMSKIGAGASAKKRDTRQKNATHQGRITTFFDSEFNPLLEIEIDGEKELIPAQDEFIVEIDERRQKIVLSLPEGLLGLNKTI